MALTYKVLGQSNPAGNTATTLYTVPASKSAVLSTISICNQSTSNGSFRIAIRPSGDALANQHYISYDTVVPNNDTIFFTIGVTLATTDVITVYANNALMSFGVFGSEIS
jgi:glucose-6-phosphate dehydrogenase assembly protein OpcA